MPIRACQFADRQFSIHVSRSLGKTRGDAPPARFDCPPEVGVITLVSAH
jgi:predicted MPP superfamily phosphohydrolase